MMLRSHQSQSDKEHDKEHDKEQLQAHQAGEQRDTNEGVAQHQFGVATHHEIRPRPTWHGEVGSRVGASRD